MLPRPSQPGPARQRAESSIFLCFVLVSLWREFSNCFLSLRSVSKVLVTSHDVAVGDQPISFSLQHVVDSTVAGVNHDLLVNLPNLLLDEEKSAVEGHVDMNGLDKIVNCPKSKQPGSKSKTDDAASPDDKNSDGRRKESVSS